MANFVIVVDVQGDFMRPEGKLTVTGAETLIGPMQDWLAALRPEETAGVLFTFDTHVPEIYARSAEGGQFPLHCVRGSDGWKLVLDPDAIDPAIPRYRLEKGVFDMWAEDDLMIERIGGDEPPVPREAFFAELREGGITDVTVIGVAADFCVRWAVDGLLEHGFRVTVPAALTRGIERPIGTVAAEDFHGAALTLA